MHTLLIPMDIAGANIRPSLHVTGMVSANVITGFSHAVCRLMKELYGVEVLDQGAAFIIRRFSYAPGHAKFTRSERGDSKVKSGMNASTVDERIGHITGWIAVRFKCSAQGVSLLKTHEMDLADQVNRLPFAGGVVGLPDRVEIFEGDDGTLALKSLPSHARVVVDYTPMLKYYSDVKGVDYFDAMKGLLLQSERQMRPAKPVAPSLTPIDEPLPAFTDDESAGAESEDALCIDDLPLGRLIPMDIGYRAIEAPRQREARGQFLHVYAEPVTGLARIQMLSSYLKNTEVNAFWIHYAQQPYYLSKGDAYHE